MIPDGHKFESRNFLNPFSGTKTLKDHSISEFRGRCLQEQVYNMLMLSDILYFIFIKRYQVYPLNI